MGFEEDSIVEYREDKKWTLYLVLCCIVTCSASFQFGYNIGVTNLPTKIIKDFYFQDKIDLLNNKTTTYNEKKAGFDDKYEKYQAGMKKYLEGEEKYADGIEKMEKAKRLLELYDVGGKEENYTAYNIVYEKAAEKNFEYMTQHGMWVEDYLKDARVRLDKANETLTNATAAIMGGKMKLATGKTQIEDGEKKLAKFQNIFWTITNSLFVAGGMLGAITSKKLSDSLGRRLSLITHNLFSIIGSLFVLGTYIFPHFSLVMASRFFYGIQGGMACSLVPSYLNEVSPQNLRGATGVIAQLNITLGILVSQLLGFRELLGTVDSWKILLAIPIIPAVFCSSFLFLFFTETPATLLKKNDKQNALIALQRLRHNVGVEEELDRIQSEIKQSSGGNDEAVSLLQIFKLKELRWPLITGVAICVVQQLCGINAVFFYSESIFKGSGIADLQIQYAVLSTGVINVIATIVAIPLIEKLGRKPLLVYPLAFMVLDFVLLTISISLQEKLKIFSYLSIFWIVLFIIAFAVGLGPIPFVYVAECFHPNAKNAALSICMLSNWTAGLLLTLCFPLLAELLNAYVFIVFSVICGIACLFVAKKVHETRNRSVDEIMAKLNNKKSNYAHHDGINDNFLAK